MKFATMLSLLLVAGACELPAFAEYRAGEPIQFGHVHHAYSEDNANNNTSSASSSSATSVTSSNTLRQLRRSVLRRAIVPLPKRAILPRLM